MKPRCSIVWMNEQNLTIQIWRNDVKYVRVLKCDVKWEVCLFFLCVFSLCCAMILLALFCEIFKLWSFVDISSCKMMLKMFLKILIMDYVCIYMVFPGNKRRCVLTWFYFSFVFLSPPSPSYWHFHFCSHLLSSHWHFVGYSFRSCFKSSSVSSAGGHAHYSATVSQSRWPLRWFKSSTVGRLPKSKWKQAWSLLYNLTFQLKVSFLCY